MIIIPMLVGRFVYGSGAVSSVLRLKRHTYTYEMPRDESSVTRSEATALTLFTWWWWYVMFPYVMRWLKKRQTYYMYLVRKHNLPKAVRTVWPSLLSDSCCCWCRSAIGIYVLLQCFEYIIYSVVCGGVFFFFFFVLVLV